MFTAAILYPTSAALLKWMMRATFNLESQGFVLETEQGNPLPHHMTINLGKLDHTLNPADILGCDIALTLKSLSWSPSIGICAAEVIPGACPCHSIARTKEWRVRSMNLYPHITVCLRPGVKPKESNRLFTAPDLIHASLDDVYMLEATIEECA